MITIVARCSAKPKVEELVNRAMDLVAASRREAGNVSYDFFEEGGDHARFTFIEVWQDQDPVDAHGATPHFRDFVERATPCPAAPLEIALYRKLS